MILKFKSSILVQLILLIIGVTLVPLLFFGYTTYSSYKKNIETKIISSNYHTLYQVDQNLGNLTGQINSIINTYNNNHSTQDYLTQTYSSDYDKIKNTDSLENELLRHIASLNWINCDIILLGANGNIFTTSTNSPRLSVTSIYNSYWYKKDMLYPDNINWFVFGRSYFTKDNNNAVIVATKNLTNQLTDEIYGTIIIEISEDYFYNIYKDTVSDDEILIIHNSEGNIISTSDRSVSLSLDPSTSFIPVEKDNLLYNYRYNNKSYVYLSQLSTVSDWSVIKLISTEKMNAEINKLQSNFVIIYIVCIFLILVGIFITAIRIYKPIEALSAKMHLKFMNHDTTLQVAPKNTFTHVITGYEHLIQEVDDTIELLIKENEARRKAELHALEMQINPHFLYNTLNSIKCLVWTGQNDLIEPTITALVKLLQQTLRHTDELITLQDELNNVKNYIYIQNIRTENSITVHYDIRPTYYNVKIPSLVLQPIIENAIFHGIEPRGTPGILTLSAYSHEEDLFIEVLDNGVGISDATMKKLLEHANNPSRSGFNHIGLANVNDRLKLYYGEDYGIRIESKVNLGTSITLKIKLLSEVIS